MKRMMPIKGSEDLTPGAGVGEDVAEARAETGVGEDAAGAIVAVGEDAAGAGAGVGEGAAEA